MPFVRYCKLVILGILGRLATPVKKDSISLLKTLMFPCMQRISCIPNFILEISQRYYKFFWVLETALANHIKTVKKVVSTCRKFRRLLACKKINFIAHYFLETFQRYCIVVILSTLGMPGCTHQIWQYQLFEYFEVYLCKFQLYLLLLSGDTAKILQTCYFEYFGQD